MLKAIFVRDARVRDVVVLRDGIRVTVRGVQLGEVGEERRPIAYLFDTNSRQWSLQPGDIVGLGHRPWPEGKAASEMLDAVDAAITAYRLGLEKPEAGRRAIREALEAYELGRAEVPEASVAEKRPRSQDELCRAGECNHPRNAAGSCVVWLMSNPSQRDC